MLLRKIITYMFGWRDFFAFPIEVRYRVIGKLCLSLVISQNLWTNVSIKTSLVVRSK